MVSSTKRVSPGKCRVISRGGWWWGEEEHALQLEMLFCILFASLYEREQKVLMSKVDRRWKHRSTKSSNPKKERKKMRVIVVLTFAGLPSF